MAPAQTLSPLGLHDRVDVAEGAGHSSAAGLVLTISSPSLLIAACLPGSSADAWEQCTAPRAVQAALRLHHTGVCSRAGVNSSCILKSFTGSYTSSAQ